MFENFKNRCSIQMNYVFRKKERHKYAQIPTNESCMYGTDTDLNEIGGRSLNFTQTVYTTQDRRA